MYSKNTICLILSVSIAFSLAQANTDFIIKCKTSDTVCTTRSGQVAWPIVAAGIPDLGITSSDPLILKSVKSDQGGLNLHFTNLIAKGLKTCNIHEFGLNLQSKRYHFDITCNILLSGQYVISGRVLVLPVTGEGDFSIKADDLKLHIEGDMEKKVEDITYWNALNFKQNNTPIGPVVFTFNNLFNGNKQLSDPVLEFVNSNYKEVLAELGNPIIEALSKKVVKNVNKLLKFLPADEYFLD